jgi:hypothetical protein
MKQTTKTLVGLLALVVVAGAVVGAAFWAGKDEAKKAEQKEKSEKLFDFDKTKVKALRIEKDGKTALALSRETSWKMVEPLQTEADDQAVSTLLEQLSTLKQKKDLGEEKDAKAYGLDKPPLAVLFKLEDGKEQGLQIGVDNTFDNTLYVRKLGDSTIRIIDGWAKSNYDKSLFDLRDKRVAHLDDSAELRRLEVSGVKSPYALEKDGGKWKLGGAEADSAAADRVQSSIKQLKATAIAAESAAKLSEYGLDKPKVTVKLGIGATGGKDTLARTILFGQPVKGGAAVKTYARRDDSPVVFEVDGQILKDLDKDPFELQDKSLVHADREEVRKLVFESGGTKIEVTRSKDALPDGGAGEESFAVVAPAKGPAKKWKVSGALYSVTGLKAAAFEGPAPKDKDLAKYGLDKPKTVTLLGEKDKVLARVRVGAEKDGKRYALADGVNKLARVEKGTVDDLPWTVNDVLETPPPAASLPDGGTAPAQASKN